jgi:predicted ArsR family transcriptional regulator
MRVKRHASLVERLKPKVMKILEESEMPLGVGEVAKKLGIAWATARAILLTLEAEGKVSALKTSKSYVYFSRDRSTTFTPQVKSGEVTR